MPMTCTTRPRAPHKLVTRVKRTEHRISGVCNSRGRGLMMKWHSKCQGKVSPKVSTANSVLLRSAWWRLRGVPIVPRVLEAPPGYVQESYRHILRMWQEGEPWSPSGRGSSDSNNSTTSSPSSMTSNTNPSNSNNTREDYLHCCSFHFSRHRQPSLKGSGGEATSSLGRSRADNRASTTKAVDKADMGVEIGSAEAGLTSYSGH